MSLPRRLEEGRVHTATRRSTQRKFLLRPDERVNAILLYGLARAATTSGVEVLALMVESTHHHQATIDDCARLSDFYRDFHALTARALNAHYGRGENLWRVGSYDNVELHGDNVTLEDQLLYVWTQPVKDGLVPTPEEWPGVKLLPEDFGREIVVHRPGEAFFGGRRPAGWEPTYGPARRRLRRERRRALGLRPGARPPKQRRDSPERRERRRLPETITFTVGVPPGYDHMTLDEVRAHFRALLDARVQQIQAERAALGLGYLGVERILTQDPEESAGDTFPTFGLNPRVACLDRDLRPAVLAELTAWRTRYRVAYGRWRAGDREVVFPYGTYGLRRFHGALVEAAPGMT